MLGDGRVVLLKEELGSTLISWLKGADSPARAQSSLRRSFSNSVLVTVQTHYWKPCAVFGIALEM